MALMLRQACEPILSDFDLDAYHADIDARTKYMCLYTPCGKRFATIHGVLFSRLHPTQSEIDYATDLLVNWCTRNLKAIDDYIAAFEHLQRTNAPKKDIELKDGSTIAIDMRGGNKEWNSEKGDWEYVTGKVNGASVKYRDVNYTLDKDLNLLSVTYSRKSPVKLGTRVTLPKTFLGKIEAHMEEYGTFIAAKKKVEDTLSQLNSCTE